MLCRVPCGECWLSRRVVLVRVPWVRSKRPRVRLQKRPRDFNTLAFSSHTRGRLNEPMGTSRCVVFFFVTSLSSCRLVVV